MKFIEAYLSGSYTIKLDKIEDERGFFARSWCKKEFEKYGLNSEIVQCNISFNKKRGTIRGMHYQESPFAEVKMVRCIKGSIYDVIIDLRKDSATYLKWSSTVLSGENYKMIYVPQGFAHGFQSLEDNTEVFYQMTEFYHPESAKGVRWDDPLLNIKWPIQDPIISERDEKFSFL